jgi:protein ImuA
LTLFHTNDWIRTNQEQMMKNLEEPLTAQGDYSFSGKGLSIARREHARRLMATALSTSGPSLPLNIEPIDARLPGRGLETALHEITPADYRSGPAAWGFLLALTKSVAGKRGGPLFWPLEKREYDFGLPYGPGLKYFGFNTNDFLFARCTSRIDSLWAMEEALRAGGFAAIIGARARKMDLTMSRRLQLAAEETHTPIFLLRSINDDALSAARTRWRITTLRAARDRFGLMRHARWHVALERARGGKTGEWVLEWNYDALCLRLPSLLAGRAAFAGEEKKSA